MGVFRRIWALGRRSKLDREIEDELREHMRMHVDADVAKGMSPDEAIREGAAALWESDGGEGACRRGGRGAGF